MLQLHSFAVGVVAFFILAIATLIPVGCSQHVQVPSCCSGEYLPGADTTLVTLPYTYHQVMSIIGSFKSNSRIKGAKKLNPVEVIFNNFTDPKIEI